MLDLHMSPLLSLAYPCSPVLLPPFSIAPQVRYIHDRDSPVPPRRLCLRPRRRIPGRDAYIYDQDQYIYSREASGNFDFRVFIVFLRSASDPRGVDACRVFPSYAP